MDPHLASVIFLIGILGLFALNRDRNLKSSKALWIPVLWLSICSSRMVSQWLAITGLANVSVTITSPADYLDGSPFDRDLLTALVAIGIVILISRRRKALALLQSNGPILLFFFYCALSILWSDFPDVTFKRWIKGIGDLTMVLIVLTDKDPFGAVKRLLTRVGFVLIPVSILLSKYYPNMGKSWSGWADSGSYNGVATSKNELGGIVLLFGLGSLWCLFQSLRNARGGGRARALIAHSAFLSMVLWLFWKADPVTAMACFLMGSFSIVVMRARVFIRRPWMVHLMVSAILVVSFSVLFLGLGPGVVQSIGRDPTTLTGRTEIWHAVLDISKNPVLGTGFETFWLGPRLAKIWSLFWWRPNEAHNGYIEVYLNLGWVGLILLGVVAATGYRNIIKAMRRNPEEGRLRLAFFVVAVAYNFTESAVRIMHPVWLLFLLATLAVPGGWTRVKSIRTKATALFSTLDPEPALTLQRL